MPVTIQTSPSGGAGTGLSGQYQKYFEKTLLPYAIQETILDQFGQKATLPKNAGALIIRFTRPDVPVAGNIQTLTEGVIMTT